VLYSYLYFAASPCVPLRKAAQPAPSPAPRDPTRNPQLQIVPLSYASSSFEPQVVNTMMPPLRVPSLSPGN
jgi:hypothetical protein